MRTDFDRIAIINRGEPAIRFIRTVRQFNRENKTQLRTIVLYTDPDRHARFIREADEAVSLGEATFFDIRAGQRKPAYLDHGRVASALMECRADALWVGWGFVSESPDFAELCARMDLVFIGPDSQSMRCLGDKISVKRLAEQVGVPVVPWACAAANTAEVALEHAPSMRPPIIDRWSFWLTSPDSMDRQNRCAAASSNLERRSGEPSSTSRARSCFA